MNNHSENHYKFSLTYLINLLTISNSDSLPKFSASCSFCSLAQLSVNVLKAALIASIRSPYLAISSANYSNLSSISLVLILNFKNYKIT